MALSDRTVVSTDWLSKHLGGDSIIIADCRYNLMDHSEGRRKYLDGHIPGAYFIDMETDLTGENKEHGGRHPIPNKPDFAQRMSSYGVETGKTVVAYDDDLSGAARLWWLLNYFGHEDVYVLDGGIGKWIQEGHMVTKTLPKERTGKFEPDVKTALAVDVEEVRTLKGQRTLIDARAPIRYEGKEEPIDIVAGHIPGAVNIHFKDIMKPDGLLRSREDLRKMFKKIGPKPIVYCGSGVTSCVDILGLAAIGIDSLLYPGSWSDWISYKENEIATGTS